MTMTFPCMERDLPNSSPSTESEGVKTTDDLIQFVPSLRSKIWTLPVADWDVGAPTMAVSPLKATLDPNWSPGSKSFGSMLSWHSGGTNWVGANVVGEGVGSGSNGDGAISGDGVGWTFPPDEDELPPPAAAAAAPPAAAAMMMTSSATPAMMAIRLDNPQIRFSSVLSGPAAPAKASSDSGGGCSPPTPPTATAPTPTPTPA
mmetsp:Transcript_32669/g.96295  ORF Transcript_32669/g.96295 Transcript_32669/m.96295 type:complete len:203 (-) Transcript_32669:1562-2170(-)